MSLYPIIELDPEIAALDPNMLPAGTLIVLPVDMSSVQMVQIVLVQLSQTQDYSMRTWLSRYPDGIAIAPGVFPVLRGQGLPFVIHTADQTPPENTNAIQVEAGNYILNILNLTNEINVFSFSTTDFP